MESREKVGLRLSEDDQQMSSAGRHSAYTAFHTAVPLPESSTNPQQRRFHTMCTSGEDFPTFHLSAQVPCSQSLLTQASQRPKSASTHQFH